MTLLSNEYRCSVVPDWLSKLTTISAAPPGEAAGVLQMMVLVELQDRAGQRVNPILTCRLVSQRPKFEPTKVRTTEPSGGPLTDEKGPEMLSPQEIGAVVDRLTHPSWGLG
eukprot:761205-Hanusia_phi.AAC.8